MLYPVYDSYGNESRWELPDAYGSLAYRRLRLDGNIYLPMEPVSAGSGSGVREIRKSDILDEYAILSKEQRLLAHVVAREYSSLLGPVLFTMLPAGRKSVELKELPADFYPPDPEPLNPFQMAAVAGMAAAPMSDPADPEIHLLFGITGSGKTRVYKALIRDALHRNSGVLYLVPEINLANRFVREMTDAFGPQLAVLHSGLPVSERYETYLRILRGQSRLVLGTRSAVFAPLARTDLIIIDEEHDTSYKQNHDLPYSALTVARLRLTLPAERTLRPRLILGSATPSAGTWYFAAHKKKIRLHELPERATGYALPQIHVPPYKDSHGIIGPFLKEKISQTLKAGNAVLLVLNRRGHSSYVYSAESGEPVHCDHCSTTMTWHKTGELRCHICGFGKPFYPDGKFWKAAGKGTQKVEDWLDLHFPGVSYARLDQDTSVSREYPEEIFHALNDGRIDILIGTQMVTKGFDIARLTLVGILNADQGLTLPDYRASERVFQLLVQASGRAGRHQPGEVVVQTMQPANQAVQAGIRGDYRGFMASELELRQAWMYPPFRQMGRILAVGDSPEEALSLLEVFLGELRQIAGQDGLFEGSILSLPEEIVGPVEAPVARIRDRFRAHALIKDARRDTLIAVGDLVRIFRERKKVPLFWDIDPADLS